MYKYQIFYNDGSEYGEHGEISTNLEDILALAENALEQGCAIRISTRWLSNYEDDHSYTRNASSCVGGELE